MFYMEETCENCQQDYMTGPTWEDGCYCADCYHLKYGCPEWCEWEYCVTNI